MSDNGLTAEEQAAFDAQREEASVVETEQVEAPPVDDAPPAEEPADSRPKMVPHAALHEERERRKELERQTAEKEKQWEQRYNMLLQRFPQPQEEQPSSQPPPLPDRDKDPVAYLEAIALTAREEAAAARQALNQRSQQDQQAQIEAYVHQHALASEQRFRAQQPDYDNAAVFIGNQLDRELELRGVTNPVQRRIAAAKEALRFTAEMMQAQKDPAEAIYELAKVRGYTPPQPNPQPNPDEQLQAVARGQQQARSSLSSARGTGPSTVTGETIAKMTPDEFAAWYNKASEKQKRVVLG